MGKAANPPKGAHRQHGRSSADGGSGLTMTARMVKQVKQMAVTKPTCKAAAPLRNQGSRDTRTGSGVATSGRHARDTPRRGSAWTVLPLQPPALAT